MPQSCPNKCNLLKDKGLMEVIEGDMVLHKARVRWGIVGFKAMIENDEAAQWQMKRECGEARNPSAKTMSLSVLPLPVHGPSRAWWRK